MGAQGPSFHSGLWGTSTEVCLHSVMGTGVPPDLPQMAQRTHHRALYLTLRGSHSDLLLQRKEKAISPASYEFLGEEQ